MSAVIHDYYCKLCDAEAYDRWSDDVADEVIVTEEAVR